MGFGLRAPNSQGRGFADQIEAIVREHNWLAPLIEPLVLVWRCALKTSRGHEPTAACYRRAHPDCRRLMMVPGVGVIVALAFAAAAAGPALFGALSSVGAISGWHLDDTNPARLTVAYVCRLLPLTYLAPDIVEAILDGRQPKGLRLAEMLGNGPLAWEQQRARLAHVRAEQAGLTQPRRGNA
jgi:hypothetical protein